MRINILVCVTINELEKNEDRDWRLFQGFFLGSCLLELYKDFSVFNCTWAITWIRSFLSELGFEYFWSLHPAAQGYSWLSPTHIQLSLQLLHLGLLFNQADRVYGSGRYDMGAWEGRMLAWLSCQGPEALRGAPHPRKGTSLLGVGAGTSKLSADLLNGI